MKTGGFLYENNLSIPNGHDIINYQRKDKI